MCICHVESKSATERSVKAPARLIWEIQINYQRSMVLSFWHRLLDMEKFDEAWHRSDIADEMEELNEAEGFFNRWSELSDVVYTVTRAQFWSKISGIRWPLRKRDYWWGMLYMFPKYTLRWCFFNFCGKLTDRSKKVHAVRNPKKIHKLHLIAEEAGVPKKKFEKICRRWVRVWPLLK